jgi:hypothetical protein
MKRITLNELRKSNPHKAGLLITALNKNRVRKISRTRLNPNLKRDIETYILTKLTNEKTHTY